MRRFINNISNHFNLPSEHMTRTLLQEHYLIDFLRYDMCETGFLLFKPGDLECMECGAKRYKSNSADGKANAARMDAVSATLLANATLYSTSTPAAKSTALEKSAAATAKAERLTAIASKVSIAAAEAQVTNIDATARGVANLKPNLTAIVSHQNKIFGATLYTTVVSRRMTH
ncbi:hypothetical protein [Absidia glauca]|uniref:Uncharacterized protein n=1 Tax=Absidia glauca TaxID=4829 RepID=A0A163J9C1_ABSGL|nr:hypothetical protein [Absidia glauca]